MKRDEALLDFVVKALVDNPDDVKIERKVDEMGVLLTLRVNREDMGKIIGKAGNTAKSIRTLLRVVGMKTDARVNLKIEEPEGGRGPSASRNDDEELLPPPTPGATEAPKASDVTSAIDDALEDLKM